MKELMQLNLIDRVNKANMNLNLASYKIRLDYNEFHTEN